MAVALASVLLAVTAAGAQARTIDSGEEPIDDTISFTACGGINLRGHVVGTDAWIDKLRGGDVDGFEYLTPWFTRVRSQFTQTVTNLDTGISFVNVTRTTSWDQRVLAVEGTTQTYRRFGTFDRTLYSDGQRQYTSVGKWSYDYVYDTLGTPDPEDDLDMFVDGSYRQVGNGRDDFCADVIHYTT